MRRSYIIGAVVVTVVLVIGLTVLLVTSPWVKNDIEKSDNRTAMLQMLDSMENLMTAGIEYDRKYYTELRECMDILDPLLGASQDAAWQGIIDYWNMNGTEDDRWGSYDTNYAELNMTVTNMLDMTIYEPCNYASNMATIHVLTELCGHKATNNSFRLPDEYVNALGTGFSTLGMGSSFMHGTHTLLGHQQDNHAISIIAYLVHQGSLSSLHGASSVLLDLSYEPRNISSLQLADEFLNMYGTLPVDQWYDKIDSLDIPDYYLLFAGICSTAFTIAFEPDVVDNIVTILANEFGLPDEFLHFIQDGYLPELRNLTSELHIGLLEKMQFIINVLGTAVKLIYAFLWQEQVLTDNTFFLDPVVNEKGWELLPVLNEMVNAINSFEYSDLNYQKGINVYPGDFWCNPVFAHAKWHLESALGLLDLVYTGDQILGILDQQNN